MMSHVSGAKALDQGQALVVASVLCDSPRRWLPDPARRAGEGWLTQVRAGRLTRMVHMEVGPPFVDGELTRRRLRWTPLGEDGVDPALLLPSFEGALEVRTGTPAVLVLSGDYSPPAGILGLAIDQLMLHHVARHTVTSLVQELGARLVQPEAAPGADVAAAPDPAAVQHPAGSRV